MNRSSKALREVVSQSRHGGRTEESEQNTESSTIGLNHHPKLMGSHGNYGKKINLKAIENSQTEKLKNDEH